MKKMGILLGLLVLMGLLLSGCDEELAEVGLFPYGQVDGEVREIIYADRIYGGG